MRRNHYRAVVVGGGVVGASVLYHLAALGWSEVLLIERAELTAGSTWHAAADFHTLNPDPNIAALQKYTIELYPRLEAETGRDCGLRMTGGISLAASQPRWEWMQAQWARYQTIGIDGVRLVSPAEIAELSPIVDVRGLSGGLHNSYEGHLDPSGTTHAYAAGATARGAEVVLHNRVVELHPRADGWQVVSEHGTVTADHVVDAGGLWARRVARMAGVDLPVTPMEHHYLVTEEIPEVAAHDGWLLTMADLEGSTYLRQEGNGVLLGVYERHPRHWHVDGAPWDFGTHLLPPAIDRIETELAAAVSRYPCLETAGIKRWVNGPFTFSPDGNPLVGPVPGLRGFWAACAVMAGFSQGGGIGLTLAEWMVHGEPGRDVLGMDVARFGSFACADGYLEATTRQFYSRRFMVRYPNEELPAGRPVRTSALHDELAKAGARFGVRWGLEVPRFFADDPAFVETPTLKRSDAFEFVRREALAVRAGVGLLDGTATARYEVAGPGARAWLDRLLASRLPAPGQARPGLMLSPSGRLTGVFTVACWEPGEFWLLGPYELRAWHLRWFDRSPGGDEFTVRDLSDGVAGLTVIGPGSSQLLGLDVRGDGTAFTHDLGPHRPRVTRSTIGGEPAFDLHLPAGELPGLYRGLGAAGPAVTPVGHDALDSLRLETSTGVWPMEYTWAHTPYRCGLDHEIDYHKTTFVGREAALADRGRPGPQHLVTLEVDAADADASGFDPVWDGDRRVGAVTSGGYGHTVGASLALGYLDRSSAVPGTQVEVQVVGIRRPATVIGDNPFAPPPDRP